MGTQLISSFQRLQLITYGDSKELQLTEIVWYWKVYSTLPEAHNIFDQGILDTSITAPNLLNKIDNLVFVIIF